MTDKSFRSFSVTVTAVYKRFTGLDAINQLRTIKY